MISIIITSYKEPKTIGKAIESAISGLKQNYEIIQISPDKETLDAGLKKAEELKISENFKQLKDPCKGKPYALNLALNEARGEILVLTDGDVFFERNATTDLTKPFEKKEVGGVTGRPVSRDKKDNMMGYFGHLLSDAAHHKRMQTQKNKDFFPMSGYIMAIENIKLKIPEDVLSDDAYISYVISNQKKEIIYVPKARAFVKYPTNLKDYYKQKTRSLGGYIQLEKYGILRKNGKTRTFKDEVKYFWFPFIYAKSFKEYIWSCFLFPIRFVTWIRIFFERRILKKDFEKTWCRIESTK